MSRALAAFSVLEDDRCRVLPISAEGYAASLPAGRSGDNRDWIADIMSYYRGLREGRLDNGGGVAPT
jgi:hypothetical protein